MGHELQLNDRQREAVQHTLGPLLILACAGTGKTAVLVNRAIHLVMVKGVDPASILIVTFTRKARFEVQERLMVALGDAGRWVHVQTFHQLANYELRRHISAFGRGMNYQILDQNASEKKVEDIRKSYRQEIVEMPSGAKIYGWYSASRNKEVPLLDILIHEGCDLLVSPIMEIIEKYEAEKVEDNLIDFDDSLFLFDQLLQEYPAISQELSEKYQYIMVDEYHDSNQVQIRMLKSLGLHRNVCVVGDGEQSIYGFRGAHANAIQEFEYMWDNVSVIPLYENYRSTQNILNLANHIKVSGPEIFSASGQEGEMPYVAFPGNDYDQMRCVANEIDYALQDGYKPSEICVLFRSLRGASFGLEMELKRRGHDFVVVGGRKATEGSHVRGFLAWLQLKYNAMNFYAWYQCLRQVKGLGDNTVAKIVNYMRHSGKSPYEGFVDYLDHETYRKGSTKRLAIYSVLSKFLIDVMHFFDAEDDVSFQYAMNLYHPIFQRMYAKGRGDIEKRWEEIEQLHTTFQLMYQGNLQEFLDNMAIEPPESGLYGDTEEKVPVERINLFTVHQAKGLEWAVVIIVNCVEGMFPSWKAKEAGEDAEERRLLYVAVTRAKDRLTIFAPEWGEQRLFLNDVIAEAMEKNLILKRVY